MSGAGEVEQAVLSLSTNDELAYILKQGINEEYFVQYPDVFNFINKYFSKYSKVPDKSVLEKRFDFKFKQSGDLEYYTDSLLELKVRRDLSEILDKGIGYLENNSMDALDYLAEKVTALKGCVGDTSNMSFTDRDASKRALEYADKMLKVNQEKILGIPTGIPVFDNAVGGWLPGNFVSIIGRMNEGKSWLLMYCCVEAYKAGQRVLFISPEMTVSEIELRFDTLESKYFSNMDLTLGRAGIDVQEYAKHLEKLGARSDWITYDSVPGGRGFTLSTLQGLVHLHKPDILAIDGIPLLTDDSGSSESWQKIQSISYGLKNMAMDNKIVILSSSQANRDAVNDNGVPKLHQVSYGDALAQACDKVISLVRVNQNKIKIAMVKNRGGRIIGEMLFDFNVDVGIISQYVQGDSDEEDLSDEFRSR